MNWMDKVLDLCQMELQNKATSKMVYLFTDSFTFDLDVIVSINEYLWVVI